MLIKYKCDVNFKTFQKYKIRTMMKAAVLKEYFLAHPVYIYIHLYVRTLYSTAALYVHCKVPQLYMYTVQYRSSICTLYSTAALYLHCTVPQLYYIHCGERRENISYQLCSSIRGRVRLPAIPRKFKVYFAILLITC